VSDAFGNGTPGVLVSLGLVGGGTLTAGGAASTNASGIVTFSGLSIDLAGSKQLTASSGSLPQATSAAFTVSPAAAASLAFVVQPTNVTAGAAITPAVQLKVFDAFGNGVAGTPVSLALVGTGTLTGGSAVSTDAAGFASFAGLRIDVAGSKQLAASSGALPGVTSGSFSVSPGAAASISFATQPSDVSSGAAIAPAVRVRVSDPLGNGVPSAPVSLALLGTGALAGRGATATDAQGIASFPSLIVKGGGSKQLAATSGALPGVNSAAFVVSCPVITLSPVSLPRTGVGLAYTVTLSALGGASPYAFVVTAGTLPAGLTLSAGGTLSGTPTGGGTSSFSVTATDANACQGAQACSVTVLDAPAAVADLTAHRLDTGNGSDGRARILLTWSPPPAGTVEVYRAPFGGYPRYDDAGGKTPATPAYPPGAPWEITAVTGSGQTDKPLTRDAWSYVAFVRNDVGQVSAVSNCTPVTADYILGDVSNHADQGFGDGIVDEADLSLMGAHYGIEGNRIVLENVRYLDVGPTTDSSPRSRPVTDGRIDFEDLFMVALNFHLTVAPASAIALGDPSAPERFELRAPSLAAARETFDVVLGVQAEGRIQGLTAQLDWDASVAQPISVAGSAWLEAQQGVVLSAGPGDIDAVLLGLRAQGLTGSGDVATVRFRALRTGDPRIRLARLDARDGANHALDAASVQIEARTAAPAQTLLFAPVPNPTHGPAQVSFALARAGRVDLAVYSVDGRRVRTLAGGPFAPGAYHFDWSGDDDSRHPVAPGVYFTQLVTQERRFSRKLVRLP